MDKKNEIDRSREFQANERTFLAWIRTSIALMGFGFVIVKFALFLKQITLMFDPSVINLKELSPTVGVIMVAIGVITAILAFIQYKRAEYQLKNERYSTDSLLTLFIFLVILIGGTAMIVYLTSVLL